MDFDAAVKLAGEKNLPLMLNFTGSDWCIWCKRMDENVFAEEVWKAYAKDNVLLVTLDFPNDKSIVPEKYLERNEKLQEQFKVQGFPTYVVLDNDGKTKLGQLGANLTPSSFIDEFKEALRMRAGAIEAFLKANPDKAEAYKGAIAELRAAEKKLEAAEKKLEAAEKPLNDWLKTRPKRTEENIKKFEGFKKSIPEALMKSIGEAQKGVAEAELAIKGFH